LGAYHWLSDNYEDGDSIYLFGALPNSSVVGTSVDREVYLGFSRGAYQVRVLSAMIDKVHYVLSSLVPEMTSPGKYRSGSSTKETRCRYHCRLQKVYALLTY
jgi:hypothetical protein